MAIDSDIPSMKPLSVVLPSSASSTSSSLLPFNHRRRLVQVATNNSATFIQFPRNAHQAFPFIPISRPRLSQSSTRLSSHTVESQSLSNQSKSSAHAPTSSITSTGDHQRNHSRPPINPILTNSLLNHRKEQPKTPPLKSSKEYSRTTRLCLSSQPFRTTLNNTQIPTIRASTAPVHAYQSNISDGLSVPIDKKTSEQTQYVDENKYDYIARWLNDVRAATYSKEALLAKTKRTKRRLLPS